MSSVEIIGFIAGFIMIFSFLPQLIRTYKTKHAADISIFMLILQMTCIGLWMIYGILTSSISLFVSNLVSVLVVVTVLIMKLIYDKQEERSAN